MVHSKKGTPEPAAVEIRRPGAVRVEASRPQATSEEMRAFFGSSARFTGTTDPDT